MITNQERIQAARDVLGKLREPGGWEVSGFRGKLIDLLLVSDTTNRALLATLYPDVVEAVVLYKEHPQGIAILQRRTRG